MIRTLCLLAIATMTAAAADVNSLLADARSARSARNFTAAEQSFNAALELAITKEMNRISSVAVEVSNFFSQQQQPDKAEAALKRALNAEDSAGQPSATKIPVLMRLTDLYQRRSADLAPVEARLVKAWEELAGPESVVLANNLYSFSGALEQTGQLAEAEQTIQRGIAILEKTYGGDAPSVGFASGRLAAIETKLGKADLAKQARDRESAIHQKYSPEEAARVGNGITAPRVISSPNPSYSERARKGKIQGAITLSLVVDADGKPTDVAVVLPLGEGLDETALQTVKTWRFQPGTNTKDGQPVQIGRA